MFFSFFFPLRFSKRKIWIFLKSYLQLLAPRKERLIKTSKHIISDILRFATSDESPTEAARCKPKLPVDSPLDLQPCFHSSRITALHANPKQGLGHHGAIVYVAALLLSFARRWHTLGCHGSPGARSEHFVLHQIATRHNPLSSLGESSRWTRGDHGDADTP